MNSKKPIRKKAASGKPSSEPAQVLLVPKGKGRFYPMGGMTSLFLADGPETRDTYSISEWWLEPGQKGSGAHAHEANDDIFYMLEGTMHFLVGKKWMGLSAGDFLRVPAGVTHDFENRGRKRAGFLNIYIPGGFEKDMPAIVDWFKENGS